VLSFQGGGDLLQGWLTDDAGLFQIVLRPFDAEVKQVVIAIQRHEYFKDANRVLAFALLKEAFRLKTELLVEFPALDAIGFGLACFKLDFAKPFFDGHRVSNRPQSTPSIPIGRMGRCHRAGFAKVQTPETIAERMDITRHSQKMKHQSLTGGTVRIRVK